jgi:drug/metabolite transporter (DMT)-like permease
VSESRKGPAAVAIVVTALSWSLAPVFIRLLSTAYDPFSQAFLRYTAAAIGIGAYAFVFYRRDFLALLLHPRPILGLACLNVVMQMAWTFGCYNSTATMAQLITKLTVVFVIIFSFFLFREERAVIRSPVFLVGTILSFLGVVVLVARAPGSLVPSMDTGSMFLVLTALFWSIYTVWGKHIVTVQLDPVPMFAAVAVFTTPMLGILSLSLGDPQTLLAADAKTTLIGIVSGLIPIALAHPCFHYAQKHLGSALCTSFNLTNPLGTYLIALAVLPGERLTLSQWLGAAILVIGAFSIVIAGRRAHQRPVAPPDHAP